MKHSESDIFEALREAFAKGIPQELCMVEDGGVLRTFNEDEDELVGTSLVPSIKVKGPREMPLYGNPIPGWKLIFRD